MRQNSSNVASFLRLWVLNCEVLINHFSKSHLLGLLDAQNKCFCKKRLFRMKKEAGLYPHHFSYQQLLVKPVREGKKSLKTHT